MEQLVYLALILLLGTISSALAFQLKTSNVFFLLLAGMVFGNFGLIQFSKEAVVTISILALIFVIFDGTQRFRFQESYSADALWLTLLFLGLCATVLTTAAFYLFSFGLAMAATFAVFAFGIDTNALLSLLRPKREKNSRALKMESLINTPLAVILCLMMLNALGGQGSYFAQMLPFVRQIMIGLAFGILIGLLTLSLLRRGYLGELSYLVVISAAVLSYVAAELLGGNGVLSVALFGFLVGNLRKELELDKFTSIVRQILTILAFIHIGAILVIPKEYILRGTLLFLLYLAVRYLSVHLSLREYDLREKLFITLNVPKGVGLAVVVLFMANVFFSLEGIETLISVCLLFVMYSIVLSTLATTIGVNLLQIKKS